MAVDVVRRNWNRKPRSAYPFAGSDLFAVPLKGGQVAFVDSSDVESVSQWSWSPLAVRNTIYAKSNVRVADGRRWFCGLHLFLMRPAPGFEVDHIDGNGLNNSRSNLRVCTHRQNMRNMRHHQSGTSDFKGVSWFARDSRWRAYIVFEAQQKHLGYFDDEVEAAHAYDAAAVRLFGAFARLNFPTITKGV